MDAPSCAVSPEQPTESASGLPELSLEPLGPATLSTALDLARRIFPSDFPSIEQDYRGWVHVPSRTVTPDGVDVSRTALFLGISQGRAVGLTGHYHYLTHPAEAWLEWFGIAPHRRRQGLGTALLQQTMAHLERAGATVLRLWTTMDPDDSAARSLYERLGFTAAPFSADFPRVLVYSVALGSAPLVPWEALPDKPPFPALITASTP